MLLLLFLPFVDSTRVLRLSCKTGLGRARNFYIELTTSASNKAELNSGEMFYSISAMDFATSEREFIRAQDRT